MGVGGVLYKLMVETKHKVHRFCLKIYMIFGYGKKKNDEE